jgi:hypothetical protein
MARTDVIAFNRNSWSQVHLQVQTSTGNGLALAARYYGTIPGIWQMRRQDQLYALDFTGDGVTDAAIFNGLEWGPSLSWALAIRRRQSHWRTGVTILRAIRCRAGKCNAATNIGSPTSTATIRQDLVVYNKDNWSTQYLGMLRSGTSNNLIVPGRTTGSAAGTSGRPMISGRGFPRSRPLGRPLRVQRRLVRPPAQLPDAIRARNHLPKVDSQSSLSRMGLVVSCERCEVAWY